MPPAPHWENNPHSTFGATKPCQLKNESLFKMHWQLCSGVLKIAKSKGNVPSCVCFCLAFLLLGTHRLLESGGMKRLNSLVGEGDTVYLLVSLWWRQWCSYVKVEPQYDLSNTYVVGLKWLDGTDMIVLLRTSNKLYLTLSA